MRYKLDVNGYVIAVAFGCYLDGCAEYTGTIPIGYNSLDDWATYSCVNAYYIDDNGNLALDQEKLAECRRREAQDKIDNTPVVRKELYGSEEVLESQYIKATVTGQAINLTDAKALPPRIKLTNVDPSAYSDLILYVSNETDTREYTILLNDLATVDYILIEKGLVIASVNGTEEIIGEGHVRLFEGVCNLYTSEAVNIEMEYSTNVQDVDSLEFLQGKETPSKKFKVLEDGSIEANGGNFSGKITSSSFEASGTIVKYSKDYGDADAELCRELVTSSIEVKPEYLEKYDFDGDGRIGSQDYVKVIKLATGEVDSYTIENSVVIDPCGNSNILRTQGVAIRNNSVYANMLSGDRAYAKNYETTDSYGNTKRGMWTGFQVSGQRNIEVTNGIVTGVSDGNHNILWNGSLYMTADQTIYLNGLISAQPNGIVLVFSAFDPKTNQVLNYDINSFFVPSYLIHKRGGNSVNHSFFLVSSDFGYVGNKYLYIQDNNIRGRASNIATGTGSGIAFYNSYWVLTEVIGV